MLNHYIPDPLDQTPNCPWAVVSKSDAALTFGSLINAMNTGSTNIFDATHDGHVRLLVTEYLRVGWDHVVRIANDFIVYMDFSKIDPGTVGIEVWSSLEGGVVYDSTRPINHQ